MKNKKKILFKKIVDKKTIAPDFQPLIEQEEIKEKILQNQKKIQKSLTQAINWLGRNE